MKEIVADVLSLPRFLYFFSVIQEPCTSDSYSGYMVQLMKDVLASLCNIKNDKALETPTADMWCDFGKITIWEPEQGTVDLRCKCILWC